MTGFHQPNDHHHHHGDHTHGDRPVLHVHGQRSRTRRAFLGDVGGGAMALALFAPAVLAACSSSDSADSVDSVDSADQTDSADASDSADPTDTSDSSDSADASVRGLQWARTNLGFVSAYVVARGNKAAIVDTGVEGSADAIGQTLTDLGLTYNDVESVILTHNHGDHVGSITEVLTRSVNASAFAGEPDLSSISGDITPLFGGEDVFGMEILSTPGHTPGSMSAIDHGAGLLIAGDAITIDGATAAEPPAQFTSDPAGARASIEMLAQLSFNTLLVGHGSPIESDADAAVAALAASF